MNQQKKQLIQAANFNQPFDNFTSSAHTELKGLLWYSNEFTFTSDKTPWKKMSPMEQQVYGRSLLSLTFLDTQQGRVGMPSIAAALPQDQHERIGLLHFIAYEEMMIHAQSYSTIFQSLMSPSEEAKLRAWGDENEALQSLVADIVAQYEQMRHYTYLRDNGALDETSDVYRVELYKTLVNSVFLESFLFYSGFFYPLYMYAQGKLMQCGEVINLIIRDELLHGVYTSMIAKEVRGSFPQDKQDELKEWSRTRVQAIHEIQKMAIRDIFNGLDYLEEDVAQFCRYNANKALMHLDVPIAFEEEELTPVVQSVVKGLSTETKDHDFFSMKGNGYHRIVVEKLEDEDFDFTNIKRTAL